VKASLRTESIGTKVSEEEFAALEATARAADMTLSEWVRAVLLSAPRLELPDDEAAFAGAGGAGGVAGADRLNRLRNCLRGQPLLIGCRSDRSMSSK
jgi:hypothetical protein